MVFEGQLGKEEIMIDKKDIKIIRSVIFVSLVLFLGGVLGYLLPRDVHIQVIEESGKYVVYYDTMQEYLLPFNETDNVTISIHGNCMLIDHVVANEQGMRYFDIGYDDEGFFLYITQLRWRGVHVADK
jgi:hypothetical protein